MYNKRGTKQALISSVLALILCFSMLIGTTYAWFTDSVTTGVNTIQSGTLDVDMVGKDGTSLVGTSLSFRNVNGSADILWEPGAKFALDSFKIVNKGNLALKYQVVINGLTNGSDVDLLDVIDFTVKIGDAAEISLAEFNQNYAKDNDSNYLLPADDNSTADESAEIVIYGKMQESAGNDYQNKKIEGVSITVYATQYTYENDSFSNLYDDIAVSAPTKLETTAVTLETSGNVTATVPSETVSALKNQGVESVSIAHTDPVVDGDVVTFESVELVDEDGAIIDLEGNTSPIKVTLPVQGFSDGDVLFVYHDGEFVANATVVNGTITYECNHFCEVVIEKTLTGSGTQADPFIIEGLNDMLKLSDLADSYNYYKIADGVTEIDALGGSIYVSLCGSFDGNGVTFKNMSDGLFRYVYGDANEAHAGTSVVKNFTVEFTNSPHGVIHFNYAKNFTMENVTVHGTIEHVGNVGSFMDFGGGSNQKTYNVTIKDCNSDATLIATANNNAGFIGHHYAANDSIYTVINSSYTGEMYGVGTPYYFCGNWMNYKITIDGNTVDNNSYKHDPAKCHKIAVNKGVLPEKYDVFTVEKAEGYDHAVAYLTIGPNGNGTTVIGGYYCGTYITEAPVVDGDKLSTVQIKNYDLFCNADGVSETGISADGTAFHIVNSAYNQEIGGADVRVVQYDSNGTILSITTWKLA